MSLHPTSATAVFGGVLSRSFVKVISNITAVNNHQSERSVNVNRPLAAYDHVKPLAVTTNPIMLGAATIAVVAAGTYCYLYGIPVAIEAVLTKAGLGVAAKNGFAISIPQLAVALVLLGAAAYTIYKFYENYKVDQDTAVYANNRTTAQKATEAAFGVDAWQTLGSAIWSGVSVASEYAVQLAKDAVEVAALATSSAAGETGRGAAATYSIVESGFRKLIRRLKI